mgnify:FL=1|jgi:SAM-dependent methyltransferase
MTYSIKKEYDTQLKSLFEDQLQDDTRLLDNMNRMLGYLNLNQIVENKSLLDLGSGKSMIVEICKKRNIQAEEISSKDSIDFEKDKIDKEDEKYDFVLFKSVIEHLFNPTNILQEIKRVLKKKGILIIITPNFSLDKKFYDDPTHVHPYNPSSLEKLLQLNIFDHINVIPFLINKPTYIWKLPFSFFFGYYCLLFKNHTFKHIPIPKFLRGKSSAMISFATKKN